MHKLNIGDLVCFNSGGMRYKTLGIVMDVDYIYNGRGIYKDPQSVLIMWSVVGKYMPRQCWSLQTKRKPIESGDITWHEWGDWIVEVK